MNQQRLDILKGLTSAALAVPIADRARFVESQDAPADLKAEALRLLAARDNQPDLLENWSLGEFLSADGEQPEIGDVIGDRYEIKELIAKGPWSRVYLASDLRLNGNRVAVKLLQGGLQEFRSKQEAVWREIQALAAVRHSGVSGLIDQGVWRSVHPYVVMQYWRGRNLREILRDGPVPTETAVAVLRQAANILQATHEAGVLHLDLKPENIVVEQAAGDELRVWLVDFGISQIKSLAGMKDTAGTPAYWAPEQLTGHPTEASDVFALARVANELLPDAKGGVRRAIQAGLLREPTSRPDTPKAFANGVIAALERGPKVRRRLVWATAGCLLASLFIWAAAFHKLRPEPVKLRAITSLKGIETDPAFSPDGKRIYFSHGPSRSEVQAIYFLDVGASAPVRFSRSAGDDSKTAVSPQSKWVAYVRQAANDGEIIVQAFEGGLEKTVHRGRIQSLSFGGDSDSLFFTECDPNDRACRIRRISLGTGAVLDYPIPPGEAKGDIDVSVSPDGKTLIFARYRTPECADLFRWPVNADGSPHGEAKQVTFLDRRIFHPEWLPGGRGAVFVAGTLTNRNLWKTELDGNAVLLSEFGDGIEQAAVAAATGRVGIVPSKEDIDLWRISVPDAGGGDIKPPERVFSSTLLDEEPRYSPDGRFVAFVSDRSGSIQAYLASRDGGTPRQLSEFDRGEKAWLSWSDQNLLSVFVRVPGVGPELHQLASGDASALARVFSAPSSVRVVGVSRDGRSVYVDAGEGENRRLERWSLGTEHREVVAEVRAAHVVESPNGEWLYYARRRGNDGLFRIDRSGGTEARLVEKISTRTSFTVHADWVYYVGPLPSLGIHALRIGDGFTKVLVPLEEIPGWGLDVAPDGKEIMLPLIEFDDADILIAEGLPQDEPRLRGISSFVEDLQSALFRLMR